MISHVSSRVVEGPGWWRKQSHARLSKLLAHTRLEATWERILYLIFLIFFIVWCAGSTNVMLFSLNLQTKR